METLAIPFIALGGLYIISNQNKNIKSYNEGFELPNTNVPNRNYPNETPVINVETDLTSKLSTVNQYDTPSVYSDKYFNPNVQNSLVNKQGLNQGDAKYYSLTGDKVNASYFEHNNMVPFFGSQLRTVRTEANSTESILDNYTGSGSQIIRKTERAPLFAPQENYQWAHGTPNNTDFYLSRQVPSMKMSNVKPFADEKVGPGIGLGYTAEGSGGYNSSLAARDLYLPKTADQLRVENKPKAGENTLLGREGPSVSRIMNRGIHGHLEKNRVDTTFELGTDHMLPAKAYDSAPTARSIHIERDQARTETNRDYTGNAGFSTSSQYVEGEYMPSKHIDLGPVAFTPAYSSGGNGAHEGDYGLKSKKAYPNNRTVNKQDDYFGVVGGAIGATVAPLLDMLRPSRRENTIGNLRPYQNPGTTVPESYIFNPADRPAPTIRETTEQNKGHLYVNANQHGGAYQVTEHQPVVNARQHTSDYYYAGNSSASSNARQPRAYDAEYNTPMTNGLKSSTLSGYTPAGGMSLLNSDINMTAKNKDDLLKNKREVNANMPYQAPSIETLGKTSQSVPLYSGMQLDRNTPDVMNQLKGNPYAISHLNGL